MADCECLPRCPFFNDRMADRPDMAEQLKQKYCQGDSARCARHMVFVELGSAAVPGDLYPQQRYRVPGILREAMVKRT